MLLLPMIVLLSLLLLFLLLELLLFRLLQLLRLLSFIIHHCHTTPATHDTVAHGTHPVTQHDARFRRRFERLLVEIRMLHIPTQGVVIKLAELRVGIRGLADSWRRLAAAGVTVSQLKKMRRSAK